MNLPWISNQTDMINLTFHKMSRAGDILLVNNIVVINQPILHPDHITVTLIRIVRYSQFSHLICFFN